MNAVALFINQVALYLILGGSAVGVGLVGILSAYHASRPMKPIEIQLKIITKIKRQQKKVKQKKNNQ